MRSARALQGPRDGLTATILAAYYVFTEGCYDLVHSSRRQQKKGFEDTLCKEIPIKLPCSGLLVPLSSIGGLCGDHILQLERERLEASNNAR